MEVTAGLFYRITCGRNQIPNAANTLAGYIASLFILGIIIEGPAVIAHLCPAISPGGGAELACIDATTCDGVARGKQGRPSRSTLTIASDSVRRILCVQV